MFWKIAVVSIFIASFLRLKTSAFPPISNTLEEQTLDTFLKEINSHFSDLMCLTLISDQDALILNKIYFDRPTVNIRVPRTTNCQETLSQLLQQIYVQKCSGYIVQMSSPDCFLKAWDQTVQSSVYRHSPRILLLSVSMEPYACTLFNMKELDYISDIVAVEIERNHTDSPPTLRIFTNNFFELQGKERKSSCLEVETISSQNEFNSSRINLFPDKIKNLRGKEIRFALFDYPPFSMLNPFDGMEVRVAVEFCRKHNCTIRQVTDGNKWGQIHGSGKGNGVLGAVYCGAADLGASAIYMWERDYFHLAFSTPYLYSNVRCLVPKPQQLPKSMNIILPFTYELWIGYVISVFLGASLLHIAQRIESFIKTKDTQFSSISYALLCTFGMSICQPPPSRIARDSTLPKLFTLLETVFLLLTASYSGALSAFLTVPIYYPTINTVDQFLESNLKWGSESDIWTVSIQDDEDTKMKSFVALFEIHPVHRLIELSFTKTFALPVEITSNGHITVQNYSTEEVISNMHLMKAPLYGSPSVTIMRKGSPYMHYYNELLHQTLDYGLLLLWEQIVTQQFLSSSLQLAIEISAGNSLDPFDNTPLGVKHIQGAFMLLGAGFSLAIVTLIIERLYYQNNIKRKSK